MTGVGGSTTLATRTVTAGQSISDNTDFSSVAAVGGGKLASFWTDSTIGALQGELLQAVRTSDGDSGNNTLVGDDLSDHFNGNGSGDTLLGNGGADVLNGGDGADNLYGGDGDDIIIGGAQGDNIQGGAGNDYIYTQHSQADLIDGEAGIDTLDTTLFSGNYTVNLTTGLTNFAGEAFVNIENLVAGSGSDTLTGTAGVNVIHGGGGNDTIYGDGDNDTLYGDAGNDKLVGGTGADNLFGGAGN